MINETQETPVADLLDALKQRDFHAAGRVLGSEAFSPEQLRTLGEGLVRRRRWADAEWLFSRVEPRDAAAEMNRRLAANMSAMQAHRPDAYQRLLDLPTTNTLVIAPARDGSGRPTIYFKRANGTAVSLCAGPDPVAAAQSGNAGLEGATPNGESLGLCGIGDGYVLAVLAAKRRPLVMDMEQAVFVFEPDPQLVRLVLMLHDFSGPAGAIAAERFRWFIGPDWAEQAEEAARQMPSQGLPAISLQQSLDGAEMHARVEAGIQRLIEADDARRQEIEAYYASLPPAEIAAVFSDRPPRRPRVLLPTTRFSTVLQYSNHDAAEAFRAMGWDAEVLIEPGPSHRNYTHTFRAVLARFKPDLVFQIDHLRHEHGDMFPPNLPFACWVQDHLPNLTTGEAGARVGPNDFVLSGMQQMYVNRYGYPRRQMLGLTKLTRPPKRPASWRSDGEDLIYVSTASQTPDAITQRLVEQFPPPLEPVIRACAGRMVEHYERGGSLPTHYDVRLFVERVEKSIGMRVTDAQLRSAMTDALFDRLSNLLYRQQALGWAAAIASRRGLKLGIYGTGWDEHPTFAPFARGPVKYGPALEELTRRSRINLAMEPFFAPSHQRLLDGLAAGGFFLVREHPASTLTPELWRFLAEHSPGNASTVTKVRDGLAPDMRAAFDELIARAGCLAEFGDPVEFVLDVAAAGLRDGDGRGEALPDLGTVSFRDAATMEARVLEFLGSAQRRREISQRQWESVARRRTYEAGVSRIVRSIGRLLADNSAAAKTRTTTTREAA
jgi:hypothetical protein